MQCGVDRVALPGRGLLRVPQEGPRVDGQFEQVMQPLEAGAVAQPHPGLAEPARREAVAVGQANVIALEPAQKDAQTIEFNVALKPDEERVITYRVRYEWR